MPSINPQTAAREAANAARKAQRLTPPPPVATPAEAPEQPTTPRRLGSIRQRPTEAPASESSE